MSGSRPDPARIGSTADLARELTLVRDLAGLTVRQVEKRTGIANSTLGGYFSGRHRPSLSSLDRVLAACDVADPHDVGAWRDALLRLRRAPRRRPAEEAPYRGLEAFGTDDAAWFFGRTRLTATTVARITQSDETGLLVVVGPSGAGKSSLLRAGVVPALEALGERVVVCTPGPQPGAELERRRAEIDTASVVVVDQFEEVFAPDVPEDERRSFVDALCSAGAGARVVIGLRADFYADALHYRRLSAALQANQIVVDPMGTAELREAIVGPAGLAGTEVDDGLVELLLSDLERRGAALPLLSHALLATWTQSGGVRMTVADYRATGGIDSAVARTAEEAVTALGPDHEQAVRQLFLRLVHVAPEAADTRRRVDRRELPSGTAAEVLDQFVLRRLVVVDTDSVEIAHEALLDAWPRLRAWIDADRLGAVTHRQLTEAAREWREAGHDPDVLLRGSRLSAASEWAGQPRGVDLNDLERGFLRAAEEQERLRVATGRRQAVRLRRLVAALAVLLLVAAGLGTYSVGQAVTIEAERDVAVSRQVAVRADALRAEDPALAAKLAVAAYRIAPTPEARSSLLNATAVPVPARLPGPAAVTQSIALDRGRGLLVSAAGNSPTVQVWAVAGPALIADTPAAAGVLAVVALSPDGRRLAAGGPAGDVVLHDLADPARPGAPVALASGGDGVLSLTFTPDGGTLVAGTATGAVRRWGLGAVPAELPATAGPAGPVQSVAVSPDGRLLAAGTADGTTFLWNLPDPVAPVVLTGPGGKVYSVAFSPDGRTLAAGSADRMVHLWDLTDPAAPVPGTPLTGPTNWVNAVAFSPDGATLAAGSSDGNARLWDVATARLTATLPHAGPVTATAFLDDATLATGEADGVAHLWPVHGPILTGFADAVFALDFDDSGRRLAVGPGGKDGTAGLFDIGTGDADTARPVGIPVRNPDGEPGFSGSAALTPDGATLAVGRRDGSVRLWDMSDAARPAALEPPLTGSTALVEQLAISPDGRWLAVSGDDNAVRLWDIEDPRAARPVATLTAASSYVLASAFSPDGAFLAAASADTNTYLWDLRAAEPRLVGTLGGPSSYAYSPAFSPDGKILAVGSADKTVRLWDVTDPARAVLLGEPLAGPANYVYSVAFSPDGATLAAASTDGTVWLWDVTRPAAATNSAVLTGPTDSVFAVAWSPDGSRIAAGSADRTVRLWSADPAAAAARLCGSTGAPLSAAEWARYVPDLPFDPECDR